MSLSKHQCGIMKEMNFGALIGEFVGRFDGSYELFVPRDKAVKTIKRATFFALLEKGYIEPADRASTNRIVQILFKEPFSRDCWYRPTERALKELFPAKETNK